MMIRLRLWIIKKLIGNIPVCANVEFHRKYGVIAKENLLVKNSIVTDENSPSQTAIRNNETITVHSDFRW